MLLRELFLLNEGYKEAQSEFSKLGRPESVKDMISKFRQLVDRNQVQGEERNIDVWRKKGWYEFQRYVFDKSQEQSKTQKKKLVKKEQDSVTVYEHNNITGVMPLNKHASVNIGRHSDWCTTKAEQQHWEEYTGKGVVLIYCFLNYRGDGNGDDMWAIAFYKNQPNSFELFTGADDNVSNEQFLEETGVAATDIIRAAIDNPNIDNVESEPPKEQKPKTYLDTIADMLTINQHNYRGKRNPEIEYALLNFFDRNHNAYSMNDEYSGRSFKRLLRTYTANIKPADMKEMDIVFQTDYLHVHPDFIKHISNPTDQQIKAAIRGNPKLIKKIPNPSREQIEMAIWTYPNIFYDISENSIAQDVYANMVISSKNGVETFFNALNPQTLDPTVEMKLAKAFPFKMHMLGYLRPETIAYIKATDPRDLQFVKGQNINGVLQPFNQT